MIELTRSPITPESVRASIESPEYGGVCVFVGEVRNVTRGRETSHLFYEAYEEMALTIMREIAEAASSQWNGRFALVHRLGELHPGDIAVVTAAACPHRGDSFDACRYLIERVKADVPIWKKEYGPGGEFWVEGEIER